MAKPRHITPTRGNVSRDQRSDLLGQQGAVIWLTGLSGSGKSTIAYALEQSLTQAGKLTYALDGDNIRRGLSSDLGFSPDDRAENIRRIGEVAALFADCGVLTITAFISPYRSDRDTARAAAGKGRFVEVYLDVPVSVCERRDPKGLYRKARAGEIEEFTGVSAPYESPLEPELRLDTEGREVEACVSDIMAYLEEGGFLRGAGST